MDLFRFAIILAVLTHTADTASKFSNTSAVITASENQNVVEFLAFLLDKIKFEENFEDLLIIKCRQAETCHCPFEDFPSSSKFPSTILDQHSTGRFKYKEHFSAAVVTLVCVKDLDNAIQIFRSKVLLDLNILRFIVHMPSANTAPNSDTSEKCCKTFFEHDIFNVMLIFHEFDTTLAYYKCRKYPPTDHAFLVGHLTNDTSRIFENQFLDMYGDPIRTFPDQHPPRSMFFNGKDGKLKMLGYVGKLVETFAEYRNATLVYPVKIERGKILLYEQLRALIDQNVLDLATGSLTSPFHVLEKGMSYPYEILAYCFMIPVPQHLPFNQVYFVILRPHILIMIFMLIIIYGVLLLYTLNENRIKFSLRDVFVNDKSIRGMLGQPYSMPANLNMKTKFICFQLGYASLLINTMYQAYLHSYFTEPPREKLISGPDDIAAAGKKILLPGSDADFLKNYTPSVLQTHPHVIKIIQNTDDFNCIRDGFDTNYIYPVNTARWRAYQKQQAYFRHPMFFLSDEFCVFKYMHFGLPLRLTLPYREIINDYIQRVWAAGLIQLWMSENFFDLVRLKLSSFDDLSQPDDNDTQLGVEDLKWIIYLYFACIMGSSLAFMGELFYWTLWLKRSIKNWCSKKF